MHNRNQGQEDIFFLKLVGEESIPKVAAELRITEGAVRGRLFRIRRRIIKYQDYLNKVRSLQMGNSRIRKFTTSGHLSEEGEE